MPRPSTRRVAAVTMAGLTTCVATLVAAPAALAAPAPLPTPVLSATTVVPGQPFTVTFAGCLPESADGPAPGIFYSSTDEDPYFGNGAQALPDGSYTFEESFQAGTPLGQYTIQGVCDQYTSDRSYPPVTVTLAATAPTPPSEPTTPGPDEDKKDKKDRKDKDNEGKVKKGKGKGRG